MIRNDRVDVYVFQKAKEGNVISGDTYFVYTTESYFICAIADGLGNGPIANESAAIIPQLLADHHDKSIDELLNLCNAQMIHKRGAAVAIVKVDFYRQKIQYSCVGNVRFYMLTGGDRMIYPLPVMGYLSGRPQHLKTQEYNYEAGDLFLLHSDGVQVKSPKACLQKSADALNLYTNVLEKVNPQDDATFIAVSLLH